MPLTAKGREILAKMEERYGHDKGKSVFYASKAKGTITAVDADVEPVAENPASLDSVVAACDDYDRKHACG